MWSKRTGKVRRVTRMKSSMESLPPEEKSEVRAFQPGRDILRYISSTHMHCFFFFRFPRCLLTATVTTDTVGKSAWQKSTQQPGSDGYSQNLYIHFSHSHSFFPKFHLLTFSYPQTHNKKHLTKVVWGKTACVQHRGRQMPAIKDPPHLWESSCLAMMN